MLRKHIDTKKIILVANKIDIVERTSNALEFYSLGLGEPFAISAINGFNSGDLLDLITADFPLAKEEKEDNVLKFAIIGKPNAGKSSIANALLDDCAADGRIQSHPVGGLLLLDQVRDLLVGQSQQPQLGLGHFGKRGEMFQGDAAGGLRGEFVKRHALFLSVHREHFTQSTRIGRASRA